MNAGQGGSAGTITGQGGRSSGGMNGGTGGAPAAGGSMAGPVTLPLVVSPDKRYLMGTNGAPFMVAGDSPQCLSANLSVANYDAYFAARAAQGFNASWVNLVCDEYTGGRTDATTYDGDRAVHRHDLRRALRYQQAEPDLLRARRRALRGGRRSRHGGVRRSDRVRRLLADHPGQQRRGRQLVRAVPRRALPQPGQHRLDERQRHGRLQHGRQVRRRGQRHSDRRRHAVANGRARLARVAEHARRSELGAERRTDESEFGLHVQSHLRFVAFRLQSLRPSSQHLHRGQLRSGESRSWTARNQCTRHPCPSLLVGPERSDRLVLRKPLGGFLDGQRHVGVESRGGQGRAADAVCEAIV